MRANNLALKSWLKSTIPAINHSVDGALRVSPRTPPHLQISRSSNANLNANPTESIDAQVKDQKNRRKLQFIVAMSQKGSDSRFSSYSSCSYTYMSVYILTFLLKMFTNKGHILCMPLVKQPTGKLIKPNCLWDPAKMHLPWIFLLLLLLLSLLLSLSLLLLLGISFPVY